MQLIHILLLTVFLTISTQLQFSSKQDHTYDLKLAPRLFDEFVKHYKRNYTGETREFKFKVFYDNLGRINAINQNVPGSWFAVIGPYADLTYMEWVKANNLTESNYTGVGSSYRNVINCTDRRGYLFERFSDKVRDDYETRTNASEEYYDSDEDLEQNETALDDQDEFYESEENSTRTHKLKRIHRVRIGS